MPGMRPEKAIRLPKRSHIRASSGTLNLMMDEGFLLLIVVKLLLALSISMILPIVILLGKGLLIICIIKALDMGGILFVMAEAKDAFTVMPERSSFAGITPPRSFIRTVSLSAKSLTVWLVGLQLTQSG